MQPALLLMLLRSKTLETSRLKISKLHSRALWGANPKSIRMDCALSDYPSKYLINHTEVPWVYTVKYFSCFVVWTIYIQCIFALLMPRLTQWVYPRRLQ